MLVKKYWASLDADGYVLCVKSPLQDDEEPNQPPLGIEFPLLLSGPLDFSLVTPMFRYRVVEGAPALTPSALAGAKAFALDFIDNSADTARATILARPTNPEEYKFALADAEAYAAAGFQGAAPRGVSGWAYAKRRQGWTAQQAAQDILDTAGLWVGAMYAIRDGRLDAKELVRDATTAYEVELILESYSDALSAVMQSVPL